MTFQFFLGDATEELKEPHDPNSSSASRSVSTHTWGCLDAALDKTVAQAAREPIREPNDRAAIPF